MITAATTLAALAILLTVAVVFYVRSNTPPGRHARSIADVTAADPVAIHEPDRGLMYPGKGTR